MKRLGSILIVQSWSTNPSQPYLIHFWEPPASLFSFSYELTGFFDCEVKTAAK